MQRFIVVNPEFACIQGDIMCASAPGAVAAVERNLTSDTDNATWQVFRAPAGFPAPGEAYSGLDADLLASLAAPIHTAANARRAQAGLALAS